MASEADSVWSTFIHTGVLALNTRSMNAQFAKALLDHASEYDNITTFATAEKLEVVVNSGMTKAMRVAFDEVLECLQHALHQVSVDLDLSVTRSAKACDGALRFIVEAFVFKYESVRLTGAVVSRCDLGQLFKDMKEGIEVAVAKLELNDARHLLGSSIALDSFVEMLRHVKLQDVVFTDCALIAVQWDDIVKAVKGSSNLQSFVTDGMCAGGLVDQNLNTLTQLLHQHGRLKVLNLSKCTDQFDLNDDDFVEAVTGHASLKKLYLPIQHTTPRRVLPFLQACFAPDNDNQPSALQTVGFAPIFFLSKPPGSRETTVAIKGGADLTRAADILSIVPSIPYVRGLDISIDRDYYRRHSMDLPGLELVEEALKTVFRPQKCLVIKLGLDYEYGLDLARLRKVLAALKNYRQLKKLSLSLYGTCEIQRLCPKSTLTHLCLKFIQPLERESDYYSSAPPLIQLLAQQQQLESLSLTMCPKDVENMLQQQDEEGEGDGFAALIEALCGHPTLWSFKVSARIYTEEVVESPFMLRLLEVADGDKNRVLRRLDLSGCEGDECEEEVLAKIHCMTRLKELLLPVRDMSDLGLDQLVGALKENTSIERLMERSTNPRHDPLQFCHRGLAQAVVRNRLWRRAREISETRHSLSLALWPRALHKLASNRPEASPVFAFLRLGADVVTQGVTNRKRIV